MQLSFDAADRLVDLVHARRGPVSAPEAARELFALRSAPEALARSLLDDVVTADARLSWQGDAIRLARVPGSETPIETAHFVVVDLETTGLTPRTARICEIGAQRVRAFELEDSYETLVDPGHPIPIEITRITGIDRRSTVGAPRPEAAVRRLLAFAGDAALVAHNARFDMAFLDHEVERFAGQRIASPVIDTVWLARRLLGERTRRVGLASLAHFFGVPTQPCHRALPDARATAEILIILLGLAQERGARNLADVVELAAPRARRLSSKRALVADAPTRPGTYVFRGRGDMVLYVGRARDLRARLRSYFAGGRQRPAVEAALGALERVDWHETGSEFEAALLEQRLLRELRPPANARGTRPDRHVYLHRRGSRWHASEEPSQHGPLPSRQRVTRAARALDGYEDDDPRRALAPLKAKLQRRVAELRYEDAARLRDRIAALEDVVSALEELERLRGLEVCLIVPARERGFVRGYAIVAGRVAATRRIPTGPGALHEASALTSVPRESPAHLTAAEADELRLVGTFLRRPPPELEVVPLEPHAVAAVACTT